MAAMSSTITPQGIISICAVADNNFSKLKSTVKSRFIYLHEIQDPGNAGTILRTADAMGVDAVIVSPGSVDMYSPKVVRATAGSLWHVPLFTGITLAQLSDQLPSVKKIALSAQGESSLLDLSGLPDVVAIFGNEARGIDALIDSDVMQVKIPMSGNAESLNLDAAAAIVIFHLSHK
jgi:TrmH family RNA methyltransferase